MNDNYYKVCYHICNWLLLVFCQCKWLIVLLLATTVNFTTVASTVKTEDEKQRIKKQRMV